jgi:L-seryl-tRNA(Ser) seleniumtransferase
MITPLLFDRRVFVKRLTALPLLAQVAAQGFLEKASAAVGKPATDNIYTRIGVRPLINARGTWTYLSGSLELPQVRAAKQQAAMHFVEIVELQRAVGERLAELSGAESALITSGAAGAMAAATAACIAGSDPAKIWQLPDTTGLKSEVVMVGGRSAFDSAIRLAGGKLVLIESHEQLQNAINENTAMIYTTDPDQRLEQEIAVAKKSKVPLLLDLAAGIPPIENISLFAKMGCDLYTFSGGKGLLGPQCTGLLFGRKDLIEAALANSSPWEGAVCRPMKVGKEEIMGCLAAVEAWMKMDLNLLYREWNARAERIAKLVETVPGAKTEIKIPEGDNRFPTLTVTWDEQAFGLTVAECGRKLREGEPRIEVLTQDNPSLVPGVREGIPNPKSPKRPDQLHIISMTLQPGEDLMVGRRLREILSAAQKAQQRAA